MPLQAAAATNGTRLERALLLIADLAAVLGESSAPQDGEEARHILGIKVAT